MKKIITQGKDMRLEFQCPVCGCVFLCDRDDYEKDGRDIFNEKQFYKTDCPNCGEDVRIEVYDD